MAAWGTGRTGQIQPSRVSRSPVWYGRNRGALKRMDMETMVRYDSGTAERNAIPVTESRQWPQRERERENQAPTGLLDGNKGH